MAEPCGCLTTPLGLGAESRELSMDAHYAEVSVRVCPDCGRTWLRYFCEQEAFTASGRWYLGALTPEQAAGLTAANAKRTLEGLDWYFTGGSYFDGKIGKGSGRVWV